MPPQNSRKKAAKRASAKAQNNRVRKKLKYENICDDDKENSCNIPSADRSINEISVSVPGVSDSSTGPGAPSGTWEVQRPPLGEVRGVRGNNKGVGYQNKIKICRKITTTRTHVTNKKKS